MRSFQLRGRIQKIGTEGRGSQYILYIVDIKISTLHIHIQNKHIAYPVLLLVLILLLLLIFILIIIIIPIIIKIIIIIIIIIIIRRIIIINN